ncbi:MAG TPA: hypothetical protein PKW06_11670, partial [Cyclobacteriaceae bacterium]|nr:hypothetical protein [Cyclobacteriaceae bacterium]
MPEGEWDGEQCQQAIANRKIKKFRMGVLRFAFPQFRAKIKSCKAHCALRQGTGKGHAILKKVVLCLGGFISNLRQIVFDGGN